MVTISPEKLFKESINAMINIYLQSAHIWFEDYSWVKIGTYL